MKKELSDLIPVSGFIEVNRRVRIDQEKRYQTAAEKGVTPCEFAFTNFKNLGYLSLIGAYNVAVIYGIMNF